MSLRTRIGIVGTSSVIPKLELAAGIAKLRSAGFEVEVHPTVLKRHLWWSNRDEERARGFWEFAQNDQTDVLFCGRGGYGASRLLPILDRWTERDGAPKRRKLLVGFSDITALSEYVRARWGWDTLHAPMPSGSVILKMPRAHERALWAWIRGEAAPEPWGKLKFFGPRPTGVVQGDLIGGNVAVWTALVGTPYAPSSEGKLVFLEEISENPGRIDRMVQQLEASGTLKGARGIVLGDFTDCEDRPPQGRVSARSKKVAPIRPQVPLRKALGEIFGGLGERLGVPVAYGLPVGHDPRRNAPLLLGVPYRLGPDGTLKRL